MLEDHGEAGDFREPAHRDRGKFIEHAIWVEMALSNVLAEAVGGMDYFHALGDAFDPSDSELLERYSARILVLGRIFGELSLRAQARLLRQVLKDIPALGDYRELCKKVDRVIDDRNVLAHAPGPTADWVSGDVGEALYELPPRTRWEFYNLGKRSKVLNMEEAFRRAEEVLQELATLLAKCLAISDSAPKSSWSDRGKVRAPREVPEWCAPRFSGFLYPRLRRGCRPLRQPQRQGHRRRVEWSGGY